MKLSWILLNFHLGIHNAKFCKNVVIACAESIFTVYGKMFSLCICDRVADLLQFHDTVLGYCVCKFIGCAISSDFTVPTYKDCFEILRPRNA